MVSTSDVDRFFKMIPSDLLVESFKRMGVSMNEPTATPIPLSELFGQCKKLASDNLAMLSGLPARCRGENLITLCEEALANPDRYPLDKLCRWQGFVEGVLACHELHWSAQYPDAGPEDKSPSPAELSALSTLFSRYCAVATNSLLASEHLPHRCRKAHLIHLCESALAHPDALSANALWRRMGFVQGVLAAQGNIDVDAERDFTRPLLHAIHEQAIPTFG